MSSIEWTGKTWNPVIGCTKVSEGCRNCYAEKTARRMAVIAESTIMKGKAPSQKMNAYRLAVKYDDHSRPLAQWSNKVFCLDDVLSIPLHWRDPRMIFVNSMSDLFHPDVPFEFIVRVFAVMGVCYKHKFQILTKRPEIMAECFANPEFHSLVNRCAAMNYCGHLDIIPEVMLGYHNTPIKKWPLPNVWLGTSCEDQATADERIPHLLRCPAAVRFLSCEPLLGPLQLNLSDRSLGNDHQFSDRYGHNGRIHWIIVGGESGPGARPCNIDWIRSIVEQCKDAGVACFVKQLGAKPYNGLYNYTPDADDYGAPSFKERWLKLKSRKGKDMAEWPVDLRVREMPEVKS